jgi:hypothetical protein
MISDSGSDPSLITKHRASLMLSFSKSKASGTPWRKAQALAVWGVTLKPELVTVLSSPQGRSGKKRTKELTH